MVKLSPAEYSYLRTSLESNPPVRPDARSIAQFRPLQAATNFMPTCYGSARVRTSDGGECIVGVKAKVTRTSSLSTSSDGPSVSSLSPQLVKVNVEMSGKRDDDPALNNYSLTLQKMLQDSKILTQEKLRLTTRFSFTLFIDALVLSHSGNNPLNLLSLTIYLALMSTRLPKLISSTDDSAAEEIPVFDDDWENSVPLAGNVIPDTTSNKNENNSSRSISEKHKKGGKSKSSKSGSSGGDVDMADLLESSHSIYYRTTPWKPPLLFVFAIIGDTILTDPSVEEEAVADGMITIGWQEGKVIAPLHFTETYSSLSVSSTTSSQGLATSASSAVSRGSGGIRPDVLKKAYALALDAGTDVADALDLIVKLDQEEEAITGPPAMF